MLKEIHLEKIKICGKCGSAKLEDFGKGKHAATIICLDCRSKWWGKWYTKEEWEAWING